MKVKLVSPEPLPPPPDEVQITMSVRDAQILRSIVYFTDSIPAAVLRSGFMAPPYTRGELGDVLSRLHTELHRGVPVA